MRTTGLILTIFGITGTAWAQLPRDSLSKVYLTACYTGSVEAQKVLPDVPQKRELLRRGYEGCDGSLLRLSASGELQQQSDAGLFGCGYALGAMFAKSGFGGEVNPPSDRLTRAYTECQSLLWQQNLLSPENHRRLTPQMLRSQLRNLVTAEEAYFADSVRYTRDVARLDLHVPLAVSLSVTLIGDGYRARASHSSGLTCYIYIGTPAAVPGRTEGDPWCDG